MTTHNIAAVHITIATFAGYQSHPSYIVQEDTAKTTNRARRFSLLRADTCKVVDFNMTKADAMRMGKLLAGHHHMPPRHFFASTGLNWAKAPTREEAIKKIAKDLGADMIRRQKAANGGAYVWTCEVHCEQATGYALENFAPVGVEWSNSEDALITSVKGTTAPYTRSTQA